LANASTTENAERIQITLRVLRVSVVNSQEFADKYYEHVKLRVDRVCSMADQPGDSYEDKSTPVP
jgi:hypothetical protein